MVERVVRIAIDSASAEAGARRVVRSLEEIARKSRETAGEIGKVGSGLLRLRRAAGVLERVRREASGNVRRLDRARTGAAPAGGPHVANFNPVGFGVANGLGGHVGRDPAFHQG